MSSGGYERLPHASSAARGVLIKRRVATQSEDLMRFENEVFPASAKWLRINKGGYLFIGANGVPADADIQTGEFVVTADTTLDKAVVRGKGSTGTLWQTDLNIGTRRFMEFLNNPGLATMSTSGVPAAPTITATATNTDDADGPWINQATTATTGNASGWVPAAYVYTRPGWRPDVRMRIKTVAAGDLSGVRLLFGLFSAVPDAINPGTLHGAWFRYDTGIDGTAFWRTCTGAGAAPTVATTTVAVAAATVYRMRIEFVGPRGGNPTSIRFYINDVLVSTHVATLPLANQTMSPAMRVVNIASAIKNVKWGELILTVEAT